MEAAEGEPTDYTRKILDNINMLRKSCKLLIDFLLEEIPTYLKQNLLKDILLNVSAPFTEMEIPDVNYYGPYGDEEESLSFYPNHPIVRGKGRYEADRYRLYGNGCRKRKNSSNNLNPGLFICLCPHGIAIGFELMINPESLRTPFEMYVQRFRVMPEHFIYDNACKLHAYALRREPARFKNTKFSIDNFQIPIIYSNAKTY